MSINLKDSIHPSVFFCLSYYYIDLPSVELTRQMVDRWQVEVIIRETKENRGAYVIL